VADEKTYDVPTGQQHKFRVDYWMTISFILNEGGQVDGDYPTYTLESTDGTYHQKLSAGGDLVAAGDYMQLQFKRLARGKIYKLTRLVAEDWSEVVFDGVTFDVIVDQERSVHDVLTDHTYGELDVDVGSAVQAVIWHPNSGGAAESEDLSDVVL
jgi:hypothetical protein